MIVGLNEWKRVDRLGKLIRILETNRVWMESQLDSPTKQ
eukprot:SAG31_NODE_46491_length_254_cov_0.670968_1_plen_38_part_10